MAFETYDSAGICDPSLRSVGDNTGAPAAASSSTVPLTPPPPQPIPPCCQPPMVMISGGTLAAIVVCATALLLGLCGMAAVLFLRRHDRRCDAGVPQPEPDLPAIKIGDSLVRQTCDTLAVSCRVLM